MILAMILIVATVFLATLFAYRIAKPLFQRMHLLDFPERYGLQRPRIPYPTGIVAIMIFIGVVFLILPMDQKNIGMLAGIVLLGIVCFLDDRRPLPSSLRLAVQCVIVLLIFAAGSRIYTLTSPFGGFLKLDTLTLSTPLFGSLPILSGIVTVLWLLLTINAMNWFDGIPGQVSVIAVIGFSMLGFLALYRNNEPEIALLSFSLAAIAAAGTFYDFPPATMLIGDTGSMFFGLMLGLLGVYHGGKIATSFLALGIPLIDALLVILERIARGQSPLKGGRDHLHHLLLRRGWSERRIVLLTAVTGTVFGGSALFMNTAEKALAAAVLVILIATLRWIINHQKTM